MTDCWQYNFPPFFTIQPNDETRKRQMNAWCDIIVDHCAKNRIFVLNVGDCLKQQPFRNDSINRCLPEDGLIQILKEMETRDRIEWIHSDSKGKYSVGSESSCLVYWLKVEEWASMLMRWVQSNGLNNTICTFYEIVDDERSSPDFAGLDERILLKCVKYLEHNGDAVLMKMDDSYGVKFL